MSSWMLPSSVRLSISSRSKSAAPWKIGSSPDCPVITGKSVTWTRSTRPAAISARFIDRLPCERNGTSDSTLSRATTSTASPRTTVAFMMLSSSAVDRALGIQTGNHFWQSQDARKPPRRRLGIRGWQCEVIDGHRHVAHHGGWKIVANVKRKPEIGRLSYDQKMEPMTKVTDIEDLRHPDAEKLLHTPDPARLAYNGRDGFPRVIPIGFWWNGTDIVVCTAPTAPKVKR